MPLRKQTKGKFFFFLSNLTKWQSGHPNDENAPFSNTSSSTRITVPMVIKMIADSFKEFFASLLASKDRIAADVDPRTSELFVLLSSPIGGPLTFRDADADEAGQTGETGIGRVEGGMADLD